MFLAFRPFGNHTNQMYQFVQGDILNKEKGICYVPLYIKNFFPYFPNLEKKYRNCKTTVLYPFLSFIFKSLNKLHLIKPYDLCNLDTCTKLAEENDKGKLIIVDNWDFKGNKIFFDNEDLLKKYHSYYKELFSVDISSVKDKYIPEEKPAVAVHIRRGDYITHCGGKYYYDDETYCSKIMELVKSAKLKDYRIIIFTNDSNINKEFYTEKFNDVVFSSESWHFDQHLMANCSYILGAPSTFTMWASYIGQVPTYHIWEKEEKITKDKLTVFTSFHKEEN